MIHSVPHSKHTRSLCGCVGFVMCVGLVICVLYLLCFVLFVLCRLFCLVYVYVSLLVLSVLPPNDNQIAINNNNNNNKQSFNAVWGTRWRSD
jgi:dolichol kinase